MDELAEASTPQCGLGVFANEEGGLSRTTGHMKCKTKSTYLPTIGKVVNSYEILLNFIAR